jgi:hypothetical protein
LRLEDIDWRADILPIRHSKAAVRPVLPLLEPLGEALIGKVFSTSLCVHQHGSKPGRALRDAKAKALVGIRAPKRQLAGKG